MRGGWNEPTKEKMLGAIRAGSYVSAACAYSRISRETFYGWLRRGRKEETGEYRDFYERVKEAESAAELIAVSNWVTAIKGGDWRASREFLARRFPSRWGVLNQGEEQNVDEAEEMAEEEQSIEPLKAPPQDPRTYFRIA
jgi:hypothetical protein